MLPFMNTSYFSAPSNQRKLKTLTTTFSLALLLLVGLLGCSDNDSTKLDAETTQKAALLVAGTDTDDATSDTARGPDGTTTRQDNGTYLQTVTISKKMLDDIKSVNILLALGYGLSRLTGYTLTDLNNILDNNSNLITDRAFFVKRLTDFLNTLASGSHQPRITCIAADSGNFRYANSIHPAPNPNICSYLESTDISSTVLLNTKNTMHPDPWSIDTNHKRDSSGLDRRILSTLKYYNSTKFQQGPESKHRIFVGSPKTHHNLLITARLMRQYYLIGNYVQDTNITWLRLSTNDQNNLYDTHGDAAEWFIKTYGSLKHFQLFHLNDYVNSSATTPIPEGRPLLTPTKFSGLYFDRVLYPPQNYDHFDVSRKHRLAYRRLSSLTPDVSDWQNNLRQTFLTMIASIVDHVYLLVKAEHSIDKIISITLADKDVVIPAEHYKTSSQSYIKLLYPLEPGEKLKIVYQDSP